MHFVKQCNWSYIFLGTRTAYVFPESLWIFSITSDTFWSLDFFFLPNFVKILLISLLECFAAIDIRHGMEKMQQAFEIYPYCAMSLNYLANHFFFTGQHFLVEQLTETALAVTMHGPTKAHSYYNLARSYHSKVGFINLACLCIICAWLEFFSRS